jgi:chemotaxis response regulator CheB
VLEDDRAIASRLTELLAQQVAYQLILVASDCLTALKFLRYCTPDFILLDKRLLHIKDIDLRPRLVLMKDLQDIPLYLFDDDFLIAECTPPTSTAQLASGHFSLDADQ